MGGYHRPNLSQTIDSAKVGNKSLITRNKKFETLQGWEEFKMPEEKKPKQIDVRKWYTEEQVMEAIKSNNKLGMDALYRTKIIH